MPGEWLEVGFDEVANESGTCDREKSGLHTDTERTEPRMSEHKRDMMRY